MEDISNYEHVLLEKATDLYNQPCMDWPDVVRELVKQGVDKSDAQMAVEFLQKQQSDEEKKKGLRLIILGAIIFACALYVYCSFYQSRQISMAMLVGGGVLVYGIDLIRK